MIDNDNWVDLRVGETGLVLGRLIAVQFGDNAGHNDPSLTIEFADWSMFPIDCDRPRDIAHIPIGTQTYVRVERTEDGLKAQAVWERGGVPVIVS